MMKMNKKNKMKQIKQICIVNNEDAKNYLLEGKIIIKEDGTFEGTIKCNNIYLSGRYNSTREIITFHTIEANPIQNIIKNYIFVIDLYSLKYIGYEVDRHGNQKECVLYMINNYKEKEIIETEINNLNHIIDNYKSTMDKNTPHQILNQKTKNSTTKKFTYNHINKNKSYF